MTVKIFAVYTKMLIEMLLSPSINIKTIRLMLLAILLPVTTTYAEDFNLLPEVIIKQTVAEVLTSLNDDNEIIHDPGKMDHLVTTMILPRFDFIYMTKLTIGNNKWTTASSQDQSNLVDEYRTLLSHLFSNALSQYDNETVTFTSTVMSSDNSSVVVKSKVISPTDEPTEMDYKLENTVNGWMVYDIEMGGIDLIRTYKSNFKNALRNGGVENLIHVLHKKNQEFNIKRKEEVHPALT